MPLSPEETRRIKVAEEDEQFQGNPWAICTASVGRSDAAKFERCVKDVKGRQGLREETLEAFRDEGVPGGGYTAVQQEDGRFTIEDVPFFAELKAGERRNKETIGKSWMEDVIERHKELEREQDYLAPVHVNHHDQNRETPRVGFLRPRRVGTLKQAGRVVPALFGDIVDVSADDLERIKDRGLPYRSAEINPDWRPEIASLALSEDEAPHFKLPLLTIGETRITRFREAEAPVLAFCEAEASNLVLFNFTGAAMPATRRKKAATKKAAKKKTVKLQEKETAPEGTEADDAAEETAESLEDTIAAIVKGMLPELVKKALAGMGPANGGGMEQPGAPAEMPQFSEETESEILADEDKDQGDTNQGGEPVAKTTDKPTPAGDENRVTQLAAKVAALEDKNRVRDRRDTIRDLVDRTCEKLREDGWDPSDTTAETMVKLADGAHEPENTLETFVATYKENTPKEPLESFGDLDGEPVEGEHEEVLKFSERGAEALAKARELSREYDQLKESGYRLESSREEFIQTNMEVA